MSAKQTPDLGDLIQSKGAPRPSDIPQRGGGAALAAPADAPAPTAAVEQAPSAQTSTPAEIQAPAQPATTMRTAAVAVAEPRTKSLTLRLSESQYQRLRRFAFDRGASHQDVIEAALMEHLNKEGV